MAPFYPGYFSADKQQTRCYSFLIRSQVRSLCVHDPPSTQEIIPFNNMTSPFGDLTSDELCDDMTSSFLVPHDNDVTNGYACTFRSCVEDRSGNMSVILGFFPNLLAVIFSLINFSGYKKNLKTVIRK